MEGIIAPEKNHVAHPASNPVLDFFAKSYPCGKEGQDAIEDYSESGAKVQVLCVRRRRLAGFRQRESYDPHPNPRPSQQQGDLLRLWEAGIRV
jgi:hypothetical protein